MPSTSSSRKVAQFYLPLPVELIHEIIKNVDMISELATLALVSKTFHDLAMPILYHRVYLDDEETALSFISCIKASMNNAKYINKLWWEMEAMDWFDDLMCLPGVNPQQLFLEIDGGWDDEVILIGEARPKHMGVTKYSNLSHDDLWVSRRMALFSHVTHLYLEDELHDAALSFCLDLRTLTHICVPIRRNLDKIDALRQILGLLGMPSMEQVVIHAKVTEEDERQDLATWQGQLNSMRFPRGDLFPFLAEIPDERLYVYPDLELFDWFTRGITPWDSGRHLPMPWRDAVRAQ